MERTRHTQALEITLEIINAVIPHASSGSHRSIRLVDADLDIAESGLDSLDVAVISAYLCELFDVPLALQKNVPCHNVRVLFDYLHQHGRRLLTCAAEVEQILAP